MNAKNKIAAYALFLIAALPLMIPVSFIIKKEIVQINAARQLKKGYLQTLQLSPENVQWIKKGKEILVAGQFFDVEEYTLSNNIVTVTGIFDKDEDKLQVDYNSMFSSKKQGNTPYHSIAIRYLFVAILNNSCSNLLQQIFLASPKPSLTYNEKLQSLSLPINLPPPKGFNTISQLN